MRSCEECYWRLSGCQPEATACEYFYPIAIGEDLTETEIEYDAGPNADAWGRAGFSVITIAEECRMSAMEIEVPVGNPEGDDADEV